MRYRRTNSRAVRRRQTPGQLPRGGKVAKPELGTKRIDPETGRKFYDLNKDPIVSPYTGKSYPRSYFDSSAISSLKDEDEDEVVEKEIDAEDDAPELVTLEEADDESKGAGDDLPDLDDDDVELDDEEDDTFLPDEEEEDDDVADIIGVGGEDDDEI
jgi:uncharacterized protein (TIGR02300 family)